MLDEFQTDAQSFAVDRAHRYCTRSGSLFSSVNPDPAAVDGVAELKVVHDQPSNVLLFQRATTRRTCHLRLWIQTPADLYAHRRTGHPSWLVGIDGNPAILPAVFTSSALDAHGQGCLAGTVRQAHGAWHAGRVAADQSEMEVDVQHLLPIFPIPEPLLKNQEWADAVDIEGTLQLADCGQFVGRAALIDAHRADHGVHVEFREHTQDHVSTPVHHVLLLERQPDV